MIDYLKGSIVKFKLTFENASENKLESVWWWQISSKILIEPKTLTEPMME